MYIYASIFFFVKVPFLENNSHESDAVSHQKRRHF